MAGVSPPTDLLIERPTSQPATRSIGLPTRIGLAIAMTIITASIAVIAYLL